MRLHSIAALLVLGLTALRADGAWPTIALEPVLTGLSAPVHLTNAGDGSGRLFVVQQGGRIRVAKAGALLSTPFLDLGNKTVGGGERGLLSAAFAPDFVSSRVFYVAYTNPAGNLVVERYRVSADPDVADGTSGQVLLTVPHPGQANHNGGQLAFGPDGYLYIGTGDGGGGGDQPNNAQNKAQLLGKILRIDVSGNSAAYSVPSSNPFVSVQGTRPEIWAYGVRNPWRFSFDRRSHELYIGDVGQDLWEEIDVQPAASTGGENYGWHVMEGTHCYNPAVCSNAGITLPVAEYSHGSGCSVTGGSVYRGRRYASLWGIYFYGDFCSGRIWGLRRKADGAWETTELLKTSLGITSFGEDEEGEVHVVDGNGAVYRVTDAAGVNAVRVAPILLDVLGAGGAHFTSELSLGNRGTTTATLSLTYTAAVSLSASGSGTVTETLPPGRQLVIPDAIEWLRGKGLAIPPGPGQGGTLRISYSGLSSSSAAFALARTTTPSGNGRAGVSSPALDLDALLDGPARLFGLRQNAADRTNLALFNAGTGGAVTLRVTLFSGDAGDGRTAILPDVTLATGQWIQMDAVLSLAGFTNGWALVERVAGNDPYFAYAVFNDNATGDGSWVAPIPADRAATEVVLPAIVETEAFETEIVLTNPTASQLLVTLLYVESLAETARDKGSLQLTLEPGEQRILPRILAILRLHLPIGLPGFSYAGSARVTFGDGLSPVAGFAGARTTVRAPLGGTYGTFYPAIPVAELAVSEAWIHGLRQDAGARSNLALVNASRTDTLTAAYDVYDGDTGLLVATVDSVVLLPSEWRQVNGILAAFGVSNGYVRVRRLSGSLLLVYGVVNDGASPAQGTSDGSFLSMSR